MNTQNSLHWAKSLLVAAIFASLAVPTKAAPVDEDRGIDGFAQTAGAFLDVGTYRPAKMIVYETDAGAIGAVTFFQAGDRTFGYDPERGSHFCPLPWSASDQALAATWCQRAVCHVAERTRAGIAAEGFNSRQGDYPNGCLLDSLLAFERIARTKPEANWEGLFILLRGVDELGGGHAVCVYLVGTVGFVYDPLGRQVSRLGPIDIQASATLARKLDPQATGGWLESRDLAWLRRHGGQITSDQN